MQTGPTDLEADLEQFSPGGAIELDPAAVVGSAPAVRYEILPGAAGMLALQNAGAITRNQRGEFLIHRKIRFPAGLSGLSVTFLLLRGVPLPDGRPVFLCRALANFSKMICRRTSPGSAT